MRPLVTPEEACEWGRRTARSAGRRRGLMIDRIWRDAHGPSKSGALPLILGLGTWQRATREVPRRELTRSRRSGHYRPTIDYRTPKVAAIWLETPQKRPLLARDGASGPGRRPLSAHDRLSHRESGRSHRATCRATAEPPGWRSTEKVAGAAARGRAAGRTAQLWCLPPLDARAHHSVATADAPPLTRRRGVGPAPAPRSRTGTGTGTRTGTRELGPTEISRIMSPGGTGGSWSRRLRRRRICRHGLVADRREPRRVDLSGRPGRPWSKRCGPLSWAQPRLP